MSDAQSSGELEPAERQKAFAEAMQMVRLDETLVWQRYAIFLVIHAVLAASLLRATVESPRNNWTAMIVGCVIGLLLCLPWAITFARGYQFAELSRRQAIRLEPPNWKIVSGSIDEYRKRTTGLARFCTIKKSTAAVIGAFAILYLGLLLAAATADRAAEVPTTQPVGLP